jgi:flagellar assembly factor FliW
MQIKSPLFGSAEIAEDKIIEFPSGLPGFEQCRRFTLLHEE